MIVCVCANLSEMQLAKLVQQGKTLIEIERETNAGLGCGKCLERLHILTGEYDEDDYCWQSRDN